jgi:hypothetical protein
MLAPPAPARLLALLACSPSMLTCLRLLACSPCLRLLACSPRLWLLACSSPMLT